MENYESSVITMEATATILFACAVIHTFAVKKIQDFGSRLRKDSMGENLVHFLSEIEIIFGIWAGILITIWSFRFGTDSSIAFLDSIDFSESIFVLVIMCMAATSPIISQAGKCLTFLARCLPLPSKLSLYATSLILGPLFGSLITEPAAMALTAILLKTSIFDFSTNMRFKYATLGLLFVNISIGGVLTNFAAPPVLMVAKTWQWNSAFMLSEFGWIAALCVGLGTVANIIVFRDELKKIENFVPAERVEKSTTKNPPFWLFLCHAVFMILVIVHSHHPSFVIPLFLLFLGWVEVTKEFQDELKLRESLLVSFFLGGLVILGKLQGWWLSPLLRSLNEFTLFFGALGLTSVTDNAALTYLGTLVSSLSQTDRILLVAGAVSGGGLTVIANAPNPIGYRILGENFGDGGISPLGLFLGALPFTVLAAVMFLIFK